MGFFIFPHRYFDFFLVVKGIVCIQQKIPYLVTVDYGETFDLFGDSDLPLKKHSVMIKKTKHLELPR